jgi:ethanolamine permease
MPEHDLSAAADDPEQLHLKRLLGPVMLWGLGVGYVISGEYFGWNLGLPEGGPYGMLIAFAAVTVMYVTFVFSYAELACAIPRAGGVFVYGVRGLGLTGGYIGGVAQVIEFVFAPPAIAMAIGEYGSIWIDAATRDSVNTWCAAFFSGLNIKVLIAIGAYVLFTALNIWGVRQAAVFELVVTVLAVGELLLFAGVALPHFQMANLTSGGLPNGFSGVIRAVPFAIWFYLAIEGVANVAEEARHPQRDVARGFGAAMITLVVLACIAFFCSVGVGGWERVVYKPESISTGEHGQIIIADDAETSDSPLPLALGQFLDVGHPLYHLLVGVGLLGLVASFNGIILASGRALLEMGRVGFLPYAIGHTHRRRKTPVAALAVNLIVGIIAICFFDTAKLITLSALGAVTLYIVAMLALLRLRVREPELVRPYKTPFYPVLPIVALVLAVGALGAMSYVNYDPKSPARSSTVLYVAMLAVALSYYRGQRRDFSSGVVRDVQKCAGRSNGAIESPRGK